MLRDRDFVASDISTPATTKRVTNYEGFIEEFEAEKWTYIPMPEDGKYYNIRTEEGPQSLAAEQIIEPDLHLLDVMELLCDQPFLLTDEGDSYEMVNLSNLNKREVKDFLYPLFSGLAEQLAYCIEDRYQDSQDMIGMVGTKTLGTWFKAQRDDVELHIAEFLTLSNMIGIIKGNDPLMDKCGFQDNDAVDGLGGVKNLRNRVMHGNRTLVNNQEMLAKHLDRIQRAERILNRLSEF